MCFTCGCEFDPNWRVFVMFENEHFVLNVGVGRVDATEEVESFFFDEVKGRGMGAEGCAMV